MQFGRPKRTAWAVLLWLVALFAFYSPDPAHTLAEWILFWPIKLTALLGPTFFALTPNQTTLYGILAGLPLTAIYWWVTGTAITGARRTPTS